MRPRGDLPAQSSTTNSRSAVVGKGEVLAFYVGGAVDEYKLLHWSECLAPLIRRLTEQALRRYWVLNLCQPGWSFDAVLDGPGNTGRRHRTHPFPFGSLEIVLAVARPNQNGEA